MGLRKNRKGSPIMADIPLPAGASLTPLPLPEGATPNRPETAYDRFLNNIQIPKLSGNQVVGPAFLSGAGELIKGAGAITELAFPEAGQNISRFGKTITEKVNEQYPVAGTTGQIASYAVPYSAAQKVVGAAKAIPQIGNVAAKIPSFALATGESAAIGGGTAALMTPTAEGRGQAAAVDAGLSTLFPVVGRTLGAGYNAVKGAVEPFYEGGRNKIIGRALREFAGNDADLAVRNLKNAPELVQGSMPTVGQSAGVPSLAALERTAMATSPEASNAFAARKLAQQNAQVNALENISTPTRMGKYVDLQTRLGDELYTDALKPLNLGKLSIGQVTEIKGLTETPAIKRAMDQARENAANRGMNIADPAGSMRGLHETKMALDEQIGTVKAKLERDGLGATSAELDGLNKAKDRLLGFMEKVSPEYKTARETYARVSKPVEQLQTIKDLASKSVSPQSDAIKVGQYLNNLKKLKDEGTLSAGQYKRLEAIAEDIKRMSAADTAGRGVGSDTVQKLAYSNMLNLQGIPNALRNFGPASFIGNVAGRAGDVAYGGANKQLKGQLAETLMEPQTAARLMEQAGLSTKADAKTEKSRQLAKLLMAQATGQVLQGE
jgi:hypothetical protein